MIETFFCVICGKQFEAGHIYQATCSASCEGLWESDAQAKLKQWNDMLVPRALNVLGFTTPEEYQEWLAKCENANRIGSQVYFLQQQGGDSLIKIGYAQDVDKRRRQLQTASAYPLDLLGSVRGDGDLERQLHIRFDDGHVRGEWYKPTPGLLSYIEQVNEGQ